jgi:hypothetical protein
MRTWLKATCSAAMLLLGAAAVHWGLGEGGRGQDAAPTPVASKAPAPPGIGVRVVQWCREHAAMIHDVQWAAACMATAAQREAQGARCLPAPTAGDPPSAQACAAALDPPDDSPDCMLPMDRAAALNAALVAAENRCIEAAAPG